MIKPNTNEKHCFFCANQVKNIDWKDTTTLQRFMSHYCRIVPRRRTGLCAKHQRKISKLIKRAREMGLMPFVRK
ncbi:MAG: 30S ribosomal protein S18 [Candidatus Kuenenbacteria bacterium]